MDIMCPRCGEPWENDTLHEAAAEQGSTYKEVHRDFQSRGCIAIGWQSTQCEATLDRGRREKLAILAELMGDDVDGIAAMTEDFGLW
jgi:hypothetical protein